MGIIRKQSLQSSIFILLYVIQFTANSFRSNIVLIHESFLKGSIFEVTDLRFREATPGVVIAHVYWKVSNIQKPGKNPLNEIMKGIFTVAAQFPLISRFFLFITNLPFLWCYSLPIFCN